MPAELGTELGENSRRAMLQIVGTATGGPNLTCRLTGEHTWHRERNSPF
jgi:hypothetical protein